MPHDYKQQAIDALNGLIADKERLEKRVEVLNRIVESESTSLAEAEAKLADAKETARKIARNAASNAVLSLVRTDATYPRNWVGTNFYADAEVDREYPAPSSGEGREAEDYGANKWRTLEEMAQAVKQGDADENAVVAWMWDALGVRRAGPTPQAAPEVDRSGEAFDVEVKSYVGGGVGYLSITPDLARRIVALATGGR